ncbi:hypothetical protein ACFYU8_25155 [Brevibacillus sp. NPDC003359]
MAKSTDLEAMFSKSHPSAKKGFNAQDNESKRQHRTHYQEVIFLLQVS